MEFKRRENIFLIRDLCSQSILHSNCIGTVNKVQHNLPLHKLLLLLGTAKASYMIGLVISQALGMAWATKFVTEPFWREGANLVSNE